MFYKELYAELGKLFYHIASADGKVREAEREKLLRLVKEKWMPVEGSVDEFGMDLANTIAFSFEFEETENLEQNGLESFAAFYNHEKNNFNPSLTNNILRTCREIAQAYRGKNKEEEQIINHLSDLFNNK